MAHDYTRRDIGNATFYQSDSTPPRMARVNAVKSVNGRTLAPTTVYTRDEHGVDRQQGGLTLEQAHFVARTFVEWDGGDAAFVVQD